MTADAHGPYTVIVTAADGHGASASQTFTWNIDQLILDNPGDQTYAENQTVTLALQADDNDGNPITFTAIGLPPNLRLVGNTIVGTVLASDVSANPYSVQVQADDDFIRIVKTITFVIRVESYTVTLVNSPIIAGYTIVNGVRTDLPDPHFHNADTVLPII
jgi:hypothetical protein